MRGGSRRIGPRSGQGADHGEGVRAFEPCGIDGRSDVRFGLGGPHGSVAVGDFALDHARPEFALGRVVRGVDLTGIIAEDQQLVARAADLGLELPGEVAWGRCRQQRRQLNFQLSLFPGQGRGGEIDDLLGQVERSSQPKLEPEGQIVGTMFEREGCVARQMRQTGLMSLAMLLLGGIAVRNPHRRLTSRHHLVGDAGGA